MPGTEDDLGFDLVLPSQSEPTISTSKEEDDDFELVLPGQEEVKKKEETQGAPTMDLPEAPTSGGTPAAPSSPSASPQGGTGSESLLKDVSFLPDFNLDAEYINAKQSEARKMSGSEIQMSQQDWVKTLEQIDRDQKKKDVEAYKEKVGSAKAEAVIKKVGAGTSNLESGELPQYITRTKDKLAEELPDDLWMKKEYELDRKIENMASPESLKTAFLTTGVSNNYRVKLNSLKTQEEKDAFKQELISNIDEMNRSIGREVSSGDQRMYKFKSLEDLAIEASGLESVYNNVLEVKTQKQELLNEKYGKINKETAKLKQELDDNPDMPEEQKAYRQAIIKRNEALKQDFIQPNGQKIAEELMSDVTGDKEQMSFYKLILDRIPEDLSPKEKFDMFYIALNDAAKQAGRETGLVDENGRYNRKFDSIIREAVGMETIPLTGIKMPDGFALTETEKDALSLLGMSDDLANIFYNNSLYRGEAASDGYFSSFMDAIQQGVESTMEGWYQYLIPQSFRAAGYGSEEAKAMNLVNTMNEVGLLDEKSVNKEGFQSFVEGIADPKGISAENVGTTLGSSFELMAEMGVGGAALKATTKAAEAYKYGRKALEYTDKAKKAMEASKYGKIFVPAIEAGIKAELTSQIRTKESLQDELGFEQFFAGQLGAEVIEGLAKKSGALRVTYLLTKALGVNAGMAADFTGKLMARAGGEITEESIQQIVQAYNQTEDGSSFTENLKQMFPDMDAVTEFLVLTGTMGAAFGVGGSYSDVRQKLKDGGYNVEKADKIMKDINTDMSEAVSKTVTPDKKETKKPTVGKVTEEAPVAQESQPVAEEATTAVAEEQVAMEPVAESKEEAKAEPVVEGEVPVVEVKPEAVVEQKAEPVVEAKQVVPESVQDQEYNEFVDKGVVQEETMNAIAEKVKAGEELTERENAIFTSKTAEVNDIIAKTEESTKKQTDETVQASETKTDKTEEVDTQKEEYKAEYRNNSLVEKINTYNKLSDAKKNSKSGVALRTQINQMAADQKRVIQPLDPKGNKIAAFDDSGKKISKRSKFTGDKTEVGEVSNQDKAWAKAEIAANNGFKTSDNNYVQLPGLSYTETKLGAQDILAGKENTKAAKKVFEAMAKVRQEGVYEFEQRAGQISQRTQVPVESTGRIQTEEEFLTEEELDQMYAERAAQEEKVKEVEKVEAQKKVKLAEVQRRLASKLREGKINKPGQLLSGTGLEAAFDLALEAAATALDGTATITEAVAKAIDAFKKSDYYKKLLPDEKKKAVSNLESHLNSEFSKLEEEVTSEVDEDISKKEGLEKQNKRKGDKNQNLKDDLDALSDIKSVDIEKARIARDKLNDKDPNRKRQIRKHIKRIIEDPSTSKELKEFLTTDSDSYYNTQSNAFSLKLAKEWIDSFESQGALDVLFEDVVDNFVEWGATGVVILDGLYSKYLHEGKATEAQAVFDAHKKLRTKIGQMLQAMGIIVNGDAIAEYMSTPISKAINIQEAIKETRDAIINKKLDPTSKSNKTVKDQIVEGITDLETAIKVISEGLASGDPEVQKAINKVVGKDGGKTNPSKKSAPKKTDAEKTEYEKKLAQEREYRKKLREEAKKNKSKYFYSSFGLTVEGIEYAGNLAASYVRSGITSAKALASKLRKSLKDDFDVDISNEDIQKAFKAAKIDEAINEQKKSEAPDKLANRVLNYVKEPGNKTEKDTIETVIRNLFAKAKESLPARTKTDTDATYREKLIEAMSEQNFSREVWEGAKTNIQDILNSKEAKGEITGAKKAELLKTLDDLFAEKVGAPFSKSLLDNTIKEQIKSDGERIQSIIKEHWTNKEARGKSLAEKIVADTDLTADQATELAGMIEKRFSSLIKEHAEKALAKSLGIDKLTGLVKQKHNATLQNIVDAVNMGALTEDAYINAFGERFGFGTITSADKAKIDSFIYNLTFMPEGSKVRDMEITRFNTFLKELETRNKGLLKVAASTMNEFFIKNILGQGHSVLRSFFGLGWVGTMSIGTESFKTAINLAVTNPKMLAKEFKTLISKKTPDLIKENSSPLFWADSVLSGIKEGGKRTIVDMYKNAYVPYDVAQEGLMDKKNKGYLDRLYETRSSDLIAKDGKIKGGAKVALKGFEFIPVTLGRTLALSDALYDVAVRPYFATTLAINKTLAEIQDGSSMTEIEFKKRIAELTASTKEHQEAAEKQAAEELAKMEEKGISTKDFNFKQRVNEIKWAMIDEDVRVAAERKASEGRLGYHPTGTLGLFYNWLNERARGSEGAAFLINTLLVPFRKIPTNAINLALDYTPWGMVRAAFGNGAIFRGLDALGLSSTTEKRAKIREKARIGKEFLKPFRKSQQGREYKGEALINDRVDVAIKSTLGTLAGSTVIYMMLDGLKRDDDDPENRFQIMGSGKDRFADNKILEQQKNRQGVKPFTFRFKYPFTNKWSNWIDYRDSPMIMWFMAAGSISDQALYTEKSDLVPYNPATLDDKLKIAFSTEFGWAATGEALLSFKEQAYFQAISDVFKVSDVRNEKGFARVGEEAYDMLKRPIKASLYPQFYAQTYQALNKDLKNVTKAKDDVWMNFYESMAKDVFFTDFLLDDYVNNAGEKVYRYESPAISPNGFATALLDYTGNYDPNENVLPSSRLMRGRDKLNYSDVFTDVLRNKNFVFKDNPRKDVPYETKVRFAKVYKQEFNEKMMENYYRLLEMEDDIFKSTIEMYRTQIVDKLLREDFDYMIRQ